MAEELNQTVPGAFLAAVGKWGDRVAMRKKEYGLWHDITWKDYYENVKNDRLRADIFGPSKG